jgi:hypothetical protein
VAACLHVIIKLVFFPIGGGDFHNRGYINECIARAAGPGGFWHVVEHVLKRPTVNPKSFKHKFKENHYNNNEEALYDYDDGLSISMLKCFEKSPYFPTSAELDACLSENGNHNNILLEKLKIWLKEKESEDDVFKYPRHLLIPWSGGAFAPLGPFLCPTTEEKKWPIAPKPGP